MTDVWSAFEDLRADRPGCVPAIARGGEPVAWHSCGSERPDGAPLTVRTPFYVASVAKQFTAAVIASLVAEQAVGLDDGVRRWFPTLGPAWDPIRVHHLLAHTAGLAVRATVERDELSSPSSTRVAQILTMPPAAPPGVVHRYSNDGYVLLAEIATRATGTSLGELARDRLFIPAAMTDTHFVDSPGPASVAGWIDGRIRADSVVQSVGDGGLISTASDLIAWSRWLPGQRIATLMLTERPLLPDGRSAHDAWGISIRTHHGQVIHSHGGSVDGYLASTISFPDLATSIVVLANTDRDGVAGSAARVHSFVDAALGDQLDLDRPSLEQTHGDPIVR